MVIAAFFSSLVSFTKLVELLSHVITMFLNQLDMESGNQMEKHKKLWEKNSLGKKGSWFCISVTHKNRDCCITEDFLGYELYKRCWIKIWCPKPRSVQPSCSFLSIILLYSETQKPNWAEMQDWEAIWVYLVWGPEHQVTDLESFLRTQFGHLKHSSEVYGFFLKHMYS